ncbi:MAG: KH domain-containing protein [Myxococcales bacterium]|nr:KH domain-containing protein [Myxococcales bacterium]
MENQGKADIEGLLRFVTTKIVSDQDVVEVTLVEEREANIYEIEVGDDDLGKIIGRGGKTAQAIRSLVNVATPRPGKRTLVEILE